MADEQGDKPNCYHMNQKLSLAKRGIEPKRPITSDETQFGPVLRTPNILYKARDGGYATYETVKDNLFNSVGKLLYPPYSKSLRSLFGTAFIALLGVILREI